MNKLKYFVEICFSSLNMFSHFLNFVTALWLTKVFNIPDAPLQPRPHTGWQECAS